MKSINKDTELWNALVVESLEKREEYGFGCCFELCSFTSRCCVQVCGVHCNVTVFGTHFPC